MTISLTTDQYRGIPLPLILSSLRWAGVTCSEVTCNVFNHPAWSLRAARGLELGLHLPTWGSVGYDLSYAAFDTQNSRIISQITELQSSFRFLYGVIHPPEGEEPDISQSVYLENIRKIPIPLLLENIPQWPLDRFVNFYMKLKNEGLVHPLRLCFDIPHALLSDGNWRPFLKAYSNEISLVHLSNCALGEDWHFPFGVPGDLKLRPVLEALRADNFNKRINLELYPHQASHIRAIFDSYYEAREFSGSPVSKRHQQNSGIISSAGEIFLSFRKIHAKQRPL